MPPPIHEVKTAQELARAQIKKKQKLLVLFREKILQEFCTYLPLLALLFTYVSMWRDNGATLVMQDAIEQRFLVDQFDYAGNHMTTITDRGQIYDWMNGILIPGLYDNIKPATGDGKNQTSQINYVTDFNVLLGGVRMYQKRVTPVPCDVKGSIFGPSPGEICYPALTDENEDKEVRTEQTVVEAQTWRSSEELGFEIFPMFSPVYEAPESGYQYLMGSYAVTMTLNKQNAVDTVAQLQKDEWIDLATRIIIVDFTMYNPENSRHITSRFAFEFLASGECSPSARINAYKLFNTNWDSASDNVIFAIEIVLYSYVLMFLAVLVVDIMRWGFIGWMVKNDIIPEATTVKSDSSGNVQDSGQSNAGQGLFEALDAVNLLLLFSLFIYRTNFMFNPAVNEYNLWNAKVNFYNHTPLALYLDLQVSIWGFNCLIAILKIFKYLQIIEQLNQLWRTVSLASKDLMYFLCIFFTVMLSFCFTGMVWFGFGSRSWYNFPSAFASLFQLMLGQFDYKSLRNVNPIPAFFFFSLFIMLVYLILLNMFLAIINNAYSVIMDGKMRDDVTEHSLKDKGTSRSFVALAKKQFNVWWSSLLVMDFSSSNKEGNEDYDDGEEDLDSSDEEALLAADRTDQANDDDKDPFLSGMVTTNAWYAVNQELDPTKSLANGEDVDLDLLEHLKARRGYLSAPTDQVAAEPSLEQIQLENAEAEREKEEANRLNLQTKFDMLQEQCVLYMELDRQLAPPWLAKRFRQLEKEAEDMGIIDIKNKAASQADLIEMTVNRSAQTSRLFSLLSSNEPMPEYATY